MRFVLIIASLVAMGLCSGCTNSSPTAGPTPTATVTATATSTPTPVKIYLSKLGDVVPAHLYPVIRYAPDGHLETFAIQQLIVGPTTTEAQSGLYSALTGRFVGTSQCGGPDFTLQFNQRGTATEAGTTTVHLCRSIPSPGDTGSFIILDEVATTLMQFPTSQKVIIVNPDGSCFADLIGC